MQWHDDRATRTVYSTDNSIYQVMPERVGLPTAASEIADALRANFAAATPQPIVARGGGTGTNGQSLTPGVVIDLKRNMKSLVSLDVAAKTVVVQPGMVTAELNAMLAEHGLFWPPHTSTLNRATIGGMISTDAAGKGSLVYGRAHRHVERLVMLLDDGTDWIAEPVTVAEAEHRAGAGGRGGELWRSILDVALNPDVVDATKLGLPELARGFSGYGIDRLRIDDMIDPVALVCGAEGTLGVVTEVTLALSPLPVSTRLVVASYATFGDALDDAVVLRGSAPAAIECFDETTLDRGRSSPAWPALGAAVGDHHGAVLLLEYTSDVATDPALGAAAPDLDAVIAALDNSGRSIARQIIDDKRAQQLIWKVRADAVGLLAKVAIGGPERSARPTAFVEDCAVPVENLAAFIAAFRQTLDEAGLSYGMFGHADVGCVHVRPALDLTDENDRQLVQTITEQVTALVREHGGLIWGEHGRGFRGAHVDEMLPASTVMLMRQVKTAFDPNDIFNPGKLYRPAASPEPVLAVTDPPMRGQFDSEVLLTVRRDFADAFACNGNGLCHHYAADEVMCPSYKATGDPSLSPRGRVDLLRSWLHDDGDGEHDSAFEDAIAENLHQCLSCSACTGHCPVEVDIPELKSRFFDDYYTRHRRPLSHRVLARFEQLASIAARAPRLAGLGRRPVERLLGLVDLPMPSGKRHPAQDVFSGQAGYDVVVVPDVFTSTLEPETAAATVVALAAVGYRTAVANFVPSGKFDHVKGQRARFAKAVELQRRMVDQIVATGAVPVVIEPAVALLHHHEYPAVDANYPNDAVRTVAELLVDRVDRLPTNGRGAQVRLLGHCTERATSPGTAQAWVTILEAAGYVVDAPAIGCCGMAGIFGHEIENQTMSRQLWDLSWSRHIEQATSAGHQIVATGYSCRSQAKRFGDVGLRHPIHLLGRFPG